MKRVALTILLCLASAAHAFGKADLVVVEKKKKTLSLYQGKTLLARFPVVFGPNPVGHKRREGDGRTPEGHYLLDFKNPDSAYYKSIRISYPNADDIERAARNGVSPGGAIMIHGQKNWLGKAWFITRRFNWTRGCVALSNQDMETVWELVEAGTPIEIKP